MPDRHKAPTQPPDHPLSLHVACPNPGHLKLDGLIVFALNVICYVKCVIICLIPIPLACSRLRRSPDLVCVVKHARSACFTTHTKSFARPGRASPGARGEASEYQTHSKSSLLGR